MRKRTLARQFAASLLKVSEEKLDSHPDFFYLERAEDEKTGKLKKDIIISQSRDLRARLQSRSWLNGYRVSIIDEAELLNGASGNALLKILEEPPEKSVLFLLTENDQVVLPTIKSRAPALFFSLVKNEEIVQGLIGMGKTKEEAERAAEWSWGRPGKAIELANSKDLQTDYLKELERWKKIIDQPFYSKLKIIEEIFGDKNDAVRGRGKLQNILDIWIMEWRKKMLEKKSNNAPEIIDTLCEAKTFLRQNIHPRLLIEQAILKF